MEKNLEKSKQQIKLAEMSSVTEPIAVGKFDQKSIEDDELDFQLETDDAADEQEEPEGEPDIEDESDEPETVEQEPDDEEEAPPVKKQLPKEQKRIVELKRKLKLAEQEKAEAQRKLAEKEENSSKEQELVSQYMEQYDETEAKRLAKADMKQSSLEKKVELLLFKDENRRVLDKYPQASGDLEKIMKAANTSGMTVEQVCRGLYGVERTEKELRALRALTEDAEETDDNTVSRSMRTSATPAKVKLTQEQQLAKRKIDLLARKNGRKPLTDKEFLKIYD